MHITQFFNDARINKDAILANFKEQIGEDCFTRLLANLKEMQVEDPISRGSFHVFMEHKIGIDPKITEAIAQELDFPEFTDEELATINRVQNRPKADNDAMLLLLLAAALFGGKR